MPDEALSSWVARIAARYDLFADQLVRHLLANTADATEMIRRLDYQTVAPLETALAEAAGQPAAGFARHRLTDLTTRSGTVWPRTRPAWCPLCVIDDVAAFGEVYSRAAWGFGGMLICARHQCLLISDCPRCSHQAGYQPINGRLRIWCRTCETGADTVLKPNRIPFWPYGTPQQHRCCVAVTLSGEAPSLLLRVQTDILDMLSGNPPGGPWSRCLKWARIFEVLRRLVFVMLGPLWEWDYQASPAQRANDGRWSLSETWSPGSLPPEIAAPALLAAVTFLAAESGTRLAGITWSRQLLIAGEDESIEAETLLWHLDRFNTRLVQDLFSPLRSRPFALLLAALHADRQGLGSAHEETRRRTGLGGALRREREANQRRLPGSEMVQRRREEPSQLYYPANRFSLSRLIEGFPPAPSPPKPRETWQEAVAVYVVLGWGPQNGDIEAPQGARVPELLRSRYIRLWIFRHRHWPAKQLIAMLAEAVDIARDRNRDIVLPELSAEPIVPMSDGMPSGCTVEGAATPHSKRARG
jgi:hypothetical protein